MREEGKWERYDEHIGWDCFLVTVQCRVPRFHAHFSLLRHRCQIKFLDFSIGEICNTERYGIAAKLRF